MKYSTELHASGELSCDEPYGVRIHGMDIEVDPYDRPFWDKAALGLWEPHTFDVLSRMLTPDSVYCDLGAWIGPTVLFAAKRCRYVVCVEPDPVAHQRLATNLRLNNVDNVTLFPFALSDKTGQQRIASFRGKLGDSMASLLAHGPSLSGAEVETVTWDAFGSACDVDAFDFIKIDIEGSEFDLLPKMEEYLVRQKPMVYLSLHPHLLPPESKEKAVRDIFYYMEMYRYCLTPDLQKVNTQNLCFHGKNAYRGTFLFADSLG